MRHTAIVVLVLAAAVSACTQTPVEQGSAANPSGSTALTSVSGGTAGAPDQGGSPAGGANGAALGSTGESGTTALNGVHAATPMGAVNAGAAPAPTFTEVTIPAGTALPVVLESTVGSDSSAVEQAVNDTIQAGIRTYDIAGDLPTATTDMFGDEVARRI